MILNWQRAAARLSRRSSFHRAPPPQHAARTRRAWPTALKWIRRTHLYLGLALVPWVLLYGITALLFNHGTWMTSDREVALGSEQLRAAAFAQLPTAEVVAAGALGQLAQRDGARALELVPDSALWLGSLSFNAKVGVADARMGIDPQLRAGRLIVEDAAELPEGPAWAQPPRLSDWEPLPREARASLVDAGLVTARSAGAALDSLTLRKLPEVRFRVRDGAREYVCDATLDGNVKVQSPEQARAWRDRLLRLHVQHGDPGYPGARALWALFVDAMGIAMVLWAATGIVMWWTIRGTRTIGLVALGAGLAALGGLALALWRASGIA